jgi:ParB/RepB/Spo0J family partition protein
MRKAQLTYIKPADLVHSPQVRNNAGQDPSFPALIESVRTFGVMQPILARVKNKAVHIVAGHRRTLAAIAAELPLVPVIIEQTPDDEVTARQLIENMHREGVSLKDTAAAVRALYDEHHSARLVADMLGRSAPWVSKMLALTAEATAPITQQLIAQDAIPDLECAYMLAVIERRTSVAYTQNTVKWMREAANPRTFLRERVKQLDAQQPAPASDDTAGKAKATTANVTLVLDMPAAEMLMRYLTGPAPCTDPHGLQIHLRGTLAQAIEKAKAAA